MIDENNIILAFRAELLEAELVKEDESSETIAIRDGDYDASKHTRESDPVIDMLIEPEDLEVNERPFDPNGKALYVRELYIPAFDAPAANTVEVLAGIMQYSVLVPVLGGNGYDVVALHNMAKYIREVFNPELSSLKTSDYHNISVAIDEASVSPALVGDAWVELPVSISFRVYNNNQP